MHTDLKLVVSLGTWQNHTQIFSEGIHLGQSRLQIFSENNLPTEYLGFPTC